MLHLSRTQAPCVFHLRRLELLFTVILPELLREQLHLLKASGAIRLDPGSSSSIISFVIVVTQVAIVCAISFDHGTYSVTGECTARLNRNCLREDPAPLRSRAIRRLV